MFDILVGEREDPLAALAYMAYKKHKREVMSRIVSETQAPPTASDIEQFYKVASSSQMIKMYVEAAQKLSTSFLGMSLEVRYAQLEVGFTSTVVGGQLAELHRKLDQRRSWKRWLADAFGNLTINFITILLIAAAVTGYQALDRLNARLSQATGLVKPVEPQR
jgi:hypothetical protein